ncbi:MAG: divalent-cation tolerance protein CutA [Thermocrispum sp.]
MGAVIVTTTAASQEAARALAADVVAARLGACAQVVGPVVSVYRWEGAVQTEPEWRVEVKTAEDRVPALVEHIITHHEYDVPEVVATPVVAGSAEYLAWVSSETRPG